MKIFTAMIKRIILCAGIVAFNQNVICQTTSIILQPNGENGKDAYIDSRLYDRNFGYHIDFPSIAWTNGGVPTIVRGLIDFDLTVIPNGAVVDSAKLSLYSYDSPNNGTHSSLSGFNESVLCRITEPWDEATVNWNNQPAYTTLNQVFLSKCLNPIQDYLDIDVTNLIHDMIDDSNNSHGFLLKLVTEMNYRRMIFASSDNIDSTLHPKLEIFYSIITPMQPKSVISSDIKLFPNPAKDILSIDVSRLDKKLTSIELLNSCGQIVSKMSHVNSVEVVDISRYSKGLYFIRLNFDNVVFTKKLIIE